MEEIKLTKNPPDITILEKIDEVTTTVQKHVRPAMMNKDGRNDGGNSELKETHEDGAGEDTLSETSQATTRYVDEFLKNINILRELIFVDKELAKSACGNCNLSRWLGTLTYSSHVDFTTLSQSAPLAVITTLLELMT